MKKSRFFSLVVSSVALLLAVAAADQKSFAVFVYFDGSTSTDFVIGANWNPENAPGTNLIDVYAIDDGLSSTFVGGLVTVKGLTGRFGGQRTSVRRDALRQIDNDGRGAGGDWRERTCRRPRAQANPFGGDYNKNSVVDAADYTLWRDTLGSSSDLRLMATRTEPSKLPTTTIGKPGLVTA